MRAAGRRRTSRYENDEVGRSIAAGRTYISRNWRPPGCVRGCFSAVSVKRRCYGLQGPIIIQAQHALPFAIVGFLFLSFFFLFSFSCSFFLCRSRVFFFAAVVSHIHFFTIFLLIFLFCSTDCLDLFHRYFSSVPLIISRVNLFTSVAIPSQSLLI